MSDPPQPDADTAPDSRDSTSPFTRTAAIVAVAVLVGIAAMVVLAPMFERPPLSRQPRLALFLRFKIVVSTFNVVVLVVLTGTYLSLYRDLPNQFTGSLALFSAALLLYALTSNPLVHLLFGFRGAGLGPFTVLPDLFAALAVVALLYQSYR